MTDPDSYFVSYDVAFFNQNRNDLLKLEVGFIKIQFLHNYSAIRPYFKITIANDKTMTISIAIQLIVPHSFIKDKNK